MIVGSSGGFFKTGQFVDLKQDHYHKLLLSFAHAMDSTDLASFGESGTAELAQLR